MKKSIFCLLVVMVLFMMTSCNEDKKFVEQGMESLKSDKQQEALVYFNKALDVNPKNLDALTEKGNILVTKSETAGEAITCFETVIKADPKNIKGWSGKGKGLLIQKKDQEALECFETALSKDPNNIDSLTGKLAVFASQEKYDEAIPLCDKILESDPNNTSILANKGWCLYLQNKKDDAIMCFDKMAEIDPKDTFAYFLKSYVLNSQGKEEEGKTCYEKVDKNSMNKEVIKNFVCDISRIAQVVDLLSEVEHCGDVNEVAEYYLKILTLDPRYEPAWTERGDFLFLSGNYEEALKCLDNALKFNPDDEKAKKCRETVIMMRALKVNTGE